jgi:hypothetical protein
MSNPREIVTYDQPSTGHGFFACSLRTAYHLDYTKKRLARLHPGAQLVIIQGCYHTGVGVSEGTHDRDTCLDVRIVGLEWMEAQSFLRAAGWAAWWRRTWQGPWADHIHMISLGFAAYDLPVGIFIDGGLSQFGPPRRTSSQVVDYYAHAWGLEGLHDPGSDPSWFPADIDATVFDFEDWEQELEANMPLNDADEAKVEAITRRVIREELAAFAKTAGANIKVDHDGKPGTAKISLERELRSE